MRLRSKGISDATAYDFDLAVMSLAVEIDATAQELIDVTEPDKPHPPKGSHWTFKPKYSIRDLLHERPDVRPDDHMPTPESLRDLPAALLGDE